MKPWRAIRRFFCGHVCYIEDIRRQQIEGVECECNRCGKTLRAPYGLALAARLAHRPRDL